MNKHIHSLLNIAYPMKKLLLTSLVLATSLSARAETLPPATPGTATAVAAAERTQWFREARFGLFIHWGVYAVPAGEWQGKAVGGIGEWIMRNGKIPVADYRAFAQNFTAAKYDPQAWARLARTAGTKYVVIGAKHHDGFALYDSAASDWNAVQASSAKRDLIAPLAKAVRAEGLKFGCYYSQSQDWINPGGAKFGGARSWDPAQDGDYDTYLQKCALLQVRELIERYDPAIIWWDTPVNMTKARAKPFGDVLAQHPNIITNDRLGEGYNGDTKTPEQHIPPRGYPGELFEVCMTMNDTWGFKKNDNNWKSVRQILRNLSDISSKGGNFLLNVGPTAEGEIPAASIERLEAVGRWMAVNSEAIYATDAGPFPRRLPWAVSPKNGPPTARPLCLPKSGSGPPMARFCCPRSRKSRSVAVCLPAARRWRRNSPPRVWWCACRGLRLMPMSPSCGWILRPRWSSLRSHSSPRVPMAG